VKPLPGAVDEEDFESHLEVHPEIQPEIHPASIRRTTADGCNRESRSN
jgi:hypothetical protein